MSSARWACWRHGISRESTLASASETRSTSRSASSSSIHARALAKAWRIVSVTLTIRQAFAKARAWMDEDEADRDVDLVSEALAKVLSREIPWRQHAHRADDIATALRVAEEYGLQRALGAGP